MGVKFTDPEKRDEYLRSLREPPTELPPVCGEPYGPWACRRASFHDGPHEGLISDVDKAVVHWFTFTSDRVGQSNIYRPRDGSQAWRTCNATTGDDT